MGKKRNILSLIVKNRHLLVALFAFFLLFFVLAGSLDVFASNQNESQAGGTYEFDGTVVSHYNLNEPYHVLNWAEMRGDETQYDSITYHSCFVGEYTGNNYFTSSQLNPSNHYGSLVPISVTVNGVTKNAPTDAYYLCAVSTGSTRYIHNYRFYGSGKIAIATNRTNYPIVVSNEPFEYIWTRSDTDGNVPVVGYSVIDTASESGLFIAWLEYTPVNVVFTDMSIYCASLDGSSGYTQVSDSAGSNDFSFDSENLFDFNNMVKDGVIPDPSAPVAPESESMYHLDFKNTAYYAGDGVQNFYHNNSFSFNDYMLDNASAFTINFEYVFSYKDDSDSIVKHFVYSQSVPLANFMGYSARMGTGGKMAVPLNCKWFVGSGGVKLSEKLNNLIHAKKGTALQYVYPNEVNGSPDYDIGDVILNDGEITQNTKKSLPYLITPFKDYIEVFTISSNITISDGSSNSYTYSDSYDWLTGSYSLTSSENTKKPYEKENQAPSNYDNSFNAPSSGGNVGSGAVVQNANPTIVVPGGSGLTQAFKLDDVNIASLADTYKFIITTLGDVRDENGFWAVIYSVYHYIPEPIWNIMLLGISTVISISVVKVSLSLFRDK